MLEIWGGEQSKPGTPQGVEASGNILRRLVEGRKAIGRCYMYLLLGGKMQCSAPIRLGRTCRRSALATSENLFAP